ncbi:MAG TPA: HD domain-containing phosphohydrolase, partial [Syntrophales bacterium]|nr:HD domain-containing phosphohydrolase [Syntrophales bacterium]
KMLDLEAANQEFRMLEERYRLSFENVSDVICTIGTDLIISDMSPSVQKLIGYTIEDLIGSPISRLKNFFTQSSYDQFIAEIHTALQGKTIPATVHQFTSREGTLKYIEVSKSPMIRIHEIVGVICVARDITERKLTEERLHETLENLRKAIGTTVNVMVSAVEIRDPYTAGHQLRVANLAQAIAMEMGVSREKIEGIRMAGSIHDIGKLSVPAEILVKPGRLTEIEYSLIKEHPQRGYEMLKDVESSWPLAQIVHQHHERMDGSGYPQGLQGDEILMEARIMAVADVFEAMASHRPYRPALKTDTALNEIVENRNILYDPEVVDACQRLFHEGRYRLD